MAENFFERPERRNYRRLDVNLDVDLTIDGKKVKSTSANISCGGMFLPTNKSPIKEKSIQVVLHLPDIQKPVKFKGEVARVEERSFFKKRKRGLAIKFNGLYDDNFLAIDRFIKNKLH